MEKIESVYKKLLEPSDDLAADIAKIDGDIIILGVGGKMGPGLARVAKEAVDKARIKKKIIGVARFSEPGLEEQLNRAGIETYKADLLNDNQLQALPEFKNVLYMAGVKFGTTGNSSYTWAMNAYLPGRVAQKYKNSRIVVFSTGNVYPMSPVYHGGVTEHSSPEPIGEYAQSCLGRERLFEYYASKYNTPLLIYRLNYANDVSYGVLLEVAKAVKEGQPIDLSMGHFNAIWQGDANEIAIRCLLHCEVPAKILNVSGPETISVRWLAEEFGRMYGRPPLFINEEQPTAFLSNTAECDRLFGYPKVSLKQVMEILVEWINQGGKTINKPTHFQERKGKY
jgi:nucleoside-diphosphate-sugar epimerase